MPINIYLEKTRVSLYYLAESSWDLAEQVSELEKWLLKNNQELPQEKIVADIGFSLGKGATGGGAVLTHSLMQLLVKCTIEVHLSEYNADQ